MFDNYLSLLDIQERPVLHNTNATNSTITVINQNTSDTTKCESIKFSDICKLFEKIFKARNSSDKLDLLFNDNLKTYLEGTSIYPLLRLVLPQIDVHRLNDLKQKGNYNLKQKSMAKIYALALNLNKENSEAYKTLINWKDPTVYENVVTGDFGMILEDILKKRVQSYYSNATLKDVNQLLDSLANATQNEKLNIIKDKILFMFNANEQKWLVRIIFNQLSIGLSYSQVFGRFYPKALTRYRECLDMKLICEEEGIISEVNGIQLFTTYSPMLAKGFPKSSIGQINIVEKTMSTNNKSTSFLMEVKLDGERMSVHIDTSLNKVSMFTRQGNDYTNNYRTLCDDILDSFKNNKMTSDLKCILDGEVCVWDKLNHCRAPFGKNRTIAKTENNVDILSDNEFGLVYSAFDIIYLDCSLLSSIVMNILQEYGCNNKLYRPGQITNLPLIVRKKILSKVVINVPNRIEVMSYKLVHNIEDTKYRIEQIETYFNQIVLEGEEGLVVKKLNSIYELGEPSRQSGSWVKVKPEYGDQTGDLDLLILGAYYGSSHTNSTNNSISKGLSSFLCGVKDSIHPNKYYTVCKVSLGFTHKELSIIRQQFKNIAIIWNNNKIPNHFGDWKPKGSEQPNVYIPPDKSIVIELKCAELTPSEKYSSGYSCRFPRVIRVRNDKSYDDILSIDDLIGLRAKPRHTTHEANEIYTQKQQQQQLLSSPSNKSNIPTTTNTTTANNKGNVIGSKRKAITTDTQYHINTNTDITNKKSNIFMNKIFCVIGNEFHYNDNTDENDIINKKDSKELISTLARNELIYAIQIHSGVVIAVPNRSDCQIIVDSNLNNLTFQINNYIMKEEKDVISVQYIVDCIDMNELIPLHRLYYLGLSQTTKELFYGITDIFGDHYTEDLKIKDTEIILSRMEYILQNLSAKHTGIHKDTTIQQYNKETNPTTSTSIITRKKYEENEEKNIISNWKYMKDKSWKEIAEYNLDHDEDKELLNIPINSLWYNNSNLIYYFDITNDLGNEICQCDKQCCKSLDKLLTMQADIATYESNNIINYQQINEMKILYYRFLLYGAKVTTHLHSGVTHIIQHSNNLSRSNIIQDRIRYLRKINVHSCEKYIFNTIWAESYLLKHCIDTNKLLDDIEL